MAYLQKRLHQQLGFVHADTGSAKAHQPVFQVSPFNRTMRRAGWDDNHRTRFDPYFRAVLHAEKAVGNVGKAVLCVASLAVWVHVVSRCVRYEDACVVAIGFTHCAPASVACKWGESMIGRDVEAALACLADREFGGNCDWCDKPCKTTKLERRRCQNANLDSPLGWRRRA